MITNAKQNKKAKIIYASVFCGILLLIIIGLYLMFPQIKLKGKETMEINYNSKYNDPGFSAKEFFSNKNKKVKVSGKVNTKKVGEYEIKYKLKGIVFSTTKTRIVKVVDKKKPVIELEDKEEITICPLAKIEEVKYNAYDEYDGDLTKKVKVEEQEDKVLYTVKDSSGNIATEERKVNRVDEENPTLNLKGSSVINVKLGSAFTEPGYEAFDNCDGDITNKVNVDGSVNVNKEGSYVLTYTVEDAKGNKVSTIRKVVVFKKVDVNSGDNKPGVIYLTFDDGPSSITTPKILDILKDEGVKATFFVTCNGPDELIKREFDEGHAIALHTCTHNWSIYRSEEAYYDDLGKVKARVSRITGQETNLIRFPGGSSNTVSRRQSTGIMSLLTNSVLNNGYRYYDWDVCGEDAGACVNAADKKGCVYKYTVNGLSKSRHNIVLLHDIKTYTVDALRDIIRYGKDNGYTFDVITPDVAMTRFKVNN